LARGKRRSLSKKIIAGAAKWLLLLLAGMVVLTVLEVLALRYFDPPLTVRMAWHQVQDALRSKPHRRPACRWRPLEQISPHLRRAVVAAEDQRFLAHHGFDFIEIQQAAADLFYANRLRGASTISMQTARTVYLLPSRTLGRKVAEAYYTILIELLWSKRRILEIYLNTVDWGPDTMGAEAASLRYFKKEAGRLTPREAALLAAVLPNPHRWSPVKPGRHVLGRHRRILADMAHVPTL